MTPKEIQETYEKLIKKQNKIHKKIIRFRESIKTLCDCPDKYGYFYKDQQDTGYGKQWNMDVKVCNICGKSFHRYNKDDNWRESS